jgi:hypothetical protein
MRRLIGYSALLTIPAVMSLTVEGFILIVQSGQPTLWRMFMIAYVLFFGAGAVLKLAVIADEHFKA